MIILGIETSCDDTCVALIEAKGRKLSRINVLSNLISSQVKIHRKYGGVYPLLAKREHQKNLPLLFKKLEEKITGLKIDLIGVTVGPGLEPCLWVGVNFSKDLSKKLNTPIIPVNHIEAHIFASLINRRTPNFELRTITFPVVSLVVSGGHTQLILVKDFGRYKILGETRDDAAGECFDKTGRLLGLGYPAGPAIEAEASKFDVRRSKFEVKLPRPMINQKNYDFSFSGLKTAVLYDYKNRGPKVRKSKDYIRAMAAEIQQAIIDVLVQKTIKAAKDYKAKTIILGGGVSANKQLRGQLKNRIRKETPNTKYQIPDTKLSTDNALMIALTAYYHYQRGIKKYLKDIRVNANLRIG
jgi:N6-L-threonylcarbamoyladenine synthase